MKKYFILALIIGCSLGANAQNRKHTGNFSQFRQIYNPALTGHEGSMVKSFYRDQWTNFEDAPRAMFISGELNLADIKNNSLFSADASQLSVAQEGVQNAFGLSLLHDTFGPIKESQYAFNYSSIVPLTAKLSLRGGASLTYTNIRLNSDKLVLNEENDQGYQNMLNGSNSQNRYGLNLGIALAGQNFYVGYAVQDAIQRTGADSKYLEDFYAMQHIAQAGFRHGLTDQLGLVVNGMYRYDANYKGVAEGQVKGVYNNIFWVGAGYRQELAYTFSGGLQLKQFRLGYTREVATGNANHVYTGGNEIVLSYSLTPVFSNIGKAVSIW
ncbi:PorP/SprF family type IX secretion system membrane protein [Botryobacter ruber]|uniref:PorP/SprF family type IX secretion system membrane protein n=1 Tax=Botryobacter ruber TaxID=2171629 RepID=UPI000E0B920C|nr:PorP/SprF family type IX secretion system membrane protein [Botryobacter ruber]